MHSSPPRFLSNLPQTDPVAVVSFDTPQYNRQIKQKLINSPPKYLIILLIGCKSIEFICNAVIFD